jgi:hypothetical protein
MQKCSMRVGWHHTPKSVCVGGLCVWICAECVRPYKKCMTLVLCCEESGGAQGSLTVQKVVEEQEEVQGIGGIICMACRAVLADQCRTLRIVKTTLARCMLLAPPCRQTNSARRVAADMAVTSRFPRRGTREVCCGLKPCSPEVKYYQSGCQGEACYGGP